MNPYVKLAKLAVETYIKDKKIISLPLDLPENFLSEKLGVFVTIEKNGGLRGCIGTYLPTRENIAEEIINNAIDAAVGDSRFIPIKEDELSYLSYSVYIIKKLEPVKDIKELDPKKYGILIKSSLSFNKSGLLLPDLEGIDTIDKQLNIACHKGGIDPSIEKIIIFKFKAEKYN